MECKREFMILMLILDIAGSNAYPSTIGVSSILCKQ
jgi:hypothetical protein